MCEFNEKNDEFCTKEDIFFDEKGQSKKPVVKGDPAVSPSFQLLIIQSLLLASETYIPFLIAKYYNLNPAS